MGLILALAVHAASIQDRDGAKFIVNSEIREAFPRLEKLWVDSGYAGRCERYLRDLGFDVEVTRRSNEGVQTQWLEPGQKPEPRKKGFEVLRWRWIVERTFGWIGRYRRHSKDYEQTAKSSRTWIFIAMSNLMLNRLV